MSAARPLAYVPLALVAGVIVAAPVLALGPVLAAAATGFTAGLEAPVFRAFGNAALPEELCKLCFVAALVARFFDARAPLRAMAIGALVGAGFGGVETLFYAVNNGAAIGLVRLFTAIPCHVFLGCVMGHYVWAARVQKSSLAAAKSLLIPTIVHGLYNLPLMAEMDVAVVRPGGAMMLTWMVLFLLAGWTRLLLARYRRQLFFAPA